MHGGVNKNDLKEENIEALEKGFENLRRHVENLRKFGLPVVVAINQFAQDTDAEIEKLEKLCKDLGVEISLCQVWAKGGEGAEDLAKKLVKNIEKQKSEINFLYDVNDSIEDKLNKIVKDIYGGRRAVLTAAAKKQVKKLVELGLDKLPICVAKTQFSFTDNKNVIGAPRDFDIEIKTVRISNGAGFIVVETSNIMIMPGLPKVPAAENMDIDDKGNIVGLF